MFVTTSLLLLQLLLHPGIGTEVYEIEYKVVADYSVYQYYVEKGSADPEGDLKFEFYQAMNTMDKAFKDSFNDGDIEIKLIPWDIEVIKDNTTTGEMRRVNKWLFTKDFPLETNWGPKTVVRQGSLLNTDVRKKLASYSPRPDHLIWVTRYDGSDAHGMSVPGGMCQESNSIMPNDANGNPVNMEGVWPNSVSVIRFMEPAPAEWRLAQIMAHELAHTIGSGHDRQIMADMDAGTEFEFTTKNKNEIKAFLAKMDKLIGANTCKETNIEHSPIKFKTCNCMKTTNCNKAARLPKLKTNYLPGKGKRVEDFCFQVPAYTKFNKPGEGCERSWGNVMAQKPCKRYCATTDCGHGTSCCNIEIALDGMDCDSSGTKHCLRSQCVAKSTPSNHDIRQRNSCAQNMG